MSGEFYCMRRTQALNELSWRVSKRQSGSGCPVLLAGNGLCSRSNRQQKRPRKNETPGMQEIEGAVPIDMLLCRELQGSWNLQDPFISTEGSGGPMFSKQGWLALFAIPWLFI